MTRAGSEARVDKAPLGAKRATAAGPVERRVRVDSAGGIATIRLCRGDAHNAIDGRWVVDFSDAVNRATEPGAARAILLVADGPSFCVGGDIQHFSANADRLSDELDDMLAGYHSALAKLADCAVPVVCAARGLAAGGGLGMLWASDIVIAGDDLKVAPAFARIALSGDGGWSYYLPRLVGLRRALELVLENRVLDAQEALEWSLVTRVLPAGEVDAEARRVAERFAAGPSLTLGTLRRLARDSATKSLREQLDAEIAAIRPTADHPDAAEASAAFLERRPPRFQ